uniref:Uncharacterized protein n=1 Tax=uncultured marine thaumarchaeote KM3_99_A02 TaxID=1456353 RepID=A0A075I017_9ARCH|nr:hypothetical protein [uncultured marine thaumarchaeote KM3_99_A02]
MKLFLDFDLCDECDSFIADLTTEESLVADDIIRNDLSVKFMRHLTYNHSEVIQAIIKEIKIQQRKPEFDLYK